MENPQELLQPLSRQNLLSLIETISRNLMCPNASFAEAESGLHPLPDNVFSYCNELTHYERLKLMQLATSDLVTEVDRLSSNYTEGYFPF